MANIVVAQEITQRLQSLEIIHHQWKPVWQELSDYIIPRKNDIYRTFTVGRKRTTQLFDSTAVHANEVLASSMAGSLTNQGTRWFVLKMRDEMLNEQHEVKLWLQDCTHRMHRALQQSNFASEILEVYLDLGALGTGCILVEEQAPTGPWFAGLQFKACNIGDYVIDEGPDGVVDTIFRRIPMTNRTVIMKWPNASENMKKAADKQPDHGRIIIHAVFPRLGRIGGTSKSLPFASYYMDEKEKIILSEGGFYELPYSVPRWTKASKEKYGRGPGHTALPDIKVLNKAKDLALKVWAKVLDPPTLIQHDGIIGNLRLTPGGINYTRGMPSQVLDQMKIDARFDISQIKEDELRASIRNIYWSNQLELQQGPQMTAQEVMVRYEMMQRLLGPTLGRLESELLSPIIKRVFNIMLREEALVPPPEMVIEYAQQGGDIDIEYESPIAKAQRSGDATSIASVFEFVGPFAQFKPEVLDNFDMDEVVRTIASVRGMPAHTMMDRRAVQQVRAQRQAAMEQEQKMIQLREMAGAGKDLAPLLKQMKEGGTEDLMEQLGGAAGAPEEEGV